jgi:hypothetical protein
MAWRKIHLDGEVWEWQTGKNVSHYVIIRSPSKVVSKVYSSRLGAPRIPVSDPEWEGQSYTYEVRPGLVKNYITNHKDILSKKPGKPRKV